MARIPRANGLVQMAFITPNLREALTEWVERRNVGPWFVSDEFVGRDCTYHGKPTDVDLTYAMSYWGQMNIEVIQQLNDAPSVFRDSIDRRGYGFHHWGVMSSDFDGTLSEFLDRGYEIEFSANVRDTRVVYLDHGGAAPGLVEVIEGTERTRASFARVYAATVTWDGDDPIRSR